MNMIYTKDHIHISGGQIIFCTGVYWILLEYCEYRWNIVNCEY